MRLFTVPNLRFLAGPVSLLDENQLAAPKTKCFGAKNQVLPEMIQMGSKGPKMIPYDQKHVILIIRDHFVTLLDHLRTSASLPCLSIFGPERDFLDPLYNNLHLSDAVIQKRVYSTTICKKKRRSNLQYK